jgi:hypothetical protein
MSPSSNECKWRKYKNKQIGEYVTCDTNDNIYESIHLAKYPKKGLTFDKEKIQEYKVVLGQKREMENEHILTKKLKKLHIQLYDGEKKHNNNTTLNKRFKFISKGKNGWKPIVPLTSLIPSKQSGGKFVKWMGFPKIDLSNDKQCEKPATSCSISKEQNEYILCQEETKKIYEGIDLLDNPSCYSHSCEIDKYFSIGKFPEGFVSFDSYLDENPSSTEVTEVTKVTKVTESKGGTGTTPSTPPNETDKPFLFFSNTKAYINHTLWNDANDGDDKTRIVPKLENGKRKSGHSFVGNKEEMENFNQVLQTITPYEHNHLNILNIVTAPLQYILPLNEASLKTGGPRPWEKRIEVISRISESVVMLKQLFRRNDRSVVNIFNIHLYDPEVEMYNYMKIYEYMNNEKEISIEALNVVDPSTIFANENSLMNYFKDSVTAQIKDQNKVLSDAGVPTQRFKPFEKMLLLCDKGTIVGSEKKLEDFITEMNINMIYCAGGETHWLNKQMKENHLFETLNKPEFKQIVWSGFSAGIINAGNTTAMAAEKVFNVFANKDRLLRGVGAVDDVTVIKSKTQGKKFCEVYNNKTDDDKITLVHTKTPDDCDMTGANWFHNGVVFPHYNPLWMEMIIDVMSQGKENIHFKDVDKLLIMADGECVYNLPLQSTDYSSKKMDRLPSDETIKTMKHELTKTKIAYARNITNSLIEFVKTIKS